MKLALLFTPRRCSSLVTSFEWSASLRCGLVLLASLCALTIGAFAQADGEDGPESSPADSSYISSFSFQGSGTGVGWMQHGHPIHDDATGKTTATFVDGNNVGTTTIVWTATGTLESWTIHYGGYTQVLSDATPQGRPGSFLLSGSLGPNQVVLINNKSYGVDNTGNRLDPTPTVNNSGYSTDLLLKSFTYKAGSSGTPVVYTYVSSALDYSGRPINVFNSSAGTCVVAGGGLSGPYSRQTSSCFPDGSHVDYSLDLVNNRFTYLTTSTAPKGFTRFGGYTLQASGDSLLFPLPQGVLKRGVTTCPLTGLRVDYNLLGQDGAYLQLVYNGSIYANVGFDGTIAQLATGAGSSADSLVLDSANPPYVYKVTSPSGTTGFTVINGVTYVLQQASNGNRLVPQGPVGSLVYGGSTYQFTGTTAVNGANGNWVSQYSTGGSSPQLATVEYSPATGTTVRMTINSPAGRAVYYDGASIGQPGAYIWNSAFSTAPNNLTSLNGTPYQQSGNVAASGNIVNTDGIVQVTGNYMSLGRWTSQATQPGVFLSYYDGQGGTAPDTVEFTGSRPRTSWLWDAIANNGNASNTMMQVDASSRLLLYPQAPLLMPVNYSVPPTVVLDPNPAGVSRFDGPVRISRQGDLSMGDFTSEPTPAP